MPATAADKFKAASNGSRPSPTTLTAIHSAGATTINCAALTGWATTTGVAFCIYTTDTSGKKVAGSQTDWTGVVSGTTITNLTLKAGTDNGYSVGAIVEASPIAAWADDVVAGITAQHNQDGTHGAVTATSLASTGGLAVSGGTVTLPAGSLALAALSTSVAWSSWTPTWTNLTVGNGTVVAKYAQIGKVVVCRLGFTLGSTSAVGSGPTFTLPVTAHSEFASLNYAMGSIIFFPGAASSCPGIWQSITATTGGMLSLTNGTNAAYQGISATVPGTWATGSRFGGDFIYEAA